MYLTKEPKKVNILNQYKNGNYQVTIYDDGTKVRETDDNVFNAEFPENFDLKITDRCSACCPFCHEGSTVNGNQSVLDHPLFDNLQAGTEVAIGGGNVFEHPDLETFLIKLKSQGVIANITVNQVHFEDNLETINRWQKEKMVYGVGISYNGSIKKLTELYFKTYNPKNIVVHVIAGIHNIDDFTNPKMKILILGYKTLRRGEKYLETYERLITRKLETLRTKLPFYLKQFEILSFDNMALDQLNVKSHVDPEDYKLHFMGDDGKHTMYIDMVKREFASSSTSLTRYDLDKYSNINEIFDIVLSEK